MNYSQHLAQNTIKIFEDPDCQQHPAEGFLWIIPLGGLGEIGRNMMILESADDLVILDAGLMFPTEDMPGIDYVIPDIRYLLQKKDKLRAIILTHGHEDHIGAIPYIIEQLDVPVYGTRLTLEILRGKLKEFNLSHRERLMVIEPGDVLEKGAFTIQFFRVIHSISESTGLIIDTPAGSIVHSGDFKFDSSPVDGKIADYSALASRADRGIRLLMADSTYAERPGYSTPEVEVGKTLNSVFSRCKGRIIVSTFASSVPRIQQVINIAQKYGRKICVLGRGLESIMAIAREFGYIEHPQEMLVKPEDMKDFPDEELLILATGSQGEPFSALTLMASSSHKWVRIKLGDTVIISATPVPGNETLVNNTINSLFRLGAEVIYERSHFCHSVPDEEFHIHASGHGSIEELKRLIDMARPEMFMPIHGEMRHLIQHARIAGTMGIADENIFQIEDGMILEMSADEARVIGRICLENILIDGLGVGDVGRIVLKDRQIMAEDGICIVVAMIDCETREIFSGPFLETRGLIYVPESQELLDDAVEMVRQFIQNNKRTRDIEVLKASVRSMLRKHFHMRIKRKPIVVPMLIEI